jgi:hypothetical protein
MDLLDNNLIIYPVNSLYFREFEKEFAKII